MIQKTIKYIFTATMIFVCGAANAQTEITNGQPTEQIETQTETQLEKEILEQPISEPETEEQTENNRFTIIKEDEPDTTHNVDSLLSIYYLQNQKEKNTISINDEIENNYAMPQPELTDDEYINRLSSIASVVHLPYNDIVRRCIVLYTQRNKERTEKILGLADYYMPIFEEIFDRKGLPLELTSMAVIESALNPKAVSRVGATGPWQFMYQTGKLYGLNITSFVDERCDPVASCEAAANYLSDLYKIFNDWTLAIAAYNCGAGNVRKAMRRAGDKTDFWEIYPYLPRETRNYIPLFVAATYTLKYYQEHGLNKVRSGMPFAVDTFMISKMLHFEQIANNTGVSVETLRDLNPQYRRDIIPGKEKLYTLILPHEYMLAFVDNENYIYTYKEDEYFNTQTLVTPAASYGGGKTSARNKSGGRIHVVRRGESVGLIAKKYHVSVSNLKKWNKIGRKNFIAPGQKLVIY